MQTYTLQAPLSEDDIVKLRAGDIVLLSGLIYTARDSAHKRIMQDLEQGAEAPFPLQGSVIYYVGPTPAPPGRAIGSAGPTTSYRMDSFASKLYQLGIKATIGKGKRSKEVRDALQKFKGVYLGATGGAGALLSQCIVQADVLAYPELGPEAVRALRVKDFPTIVINDSHMGELFNDPQLDAALGV